MSAKDGEEPGSLDVRVLPARGRSRGLRGLPSTEVGVVGSAYYVQRVSERLHNNHYMLVREPRNRFDSNAIAVYSKGRKVCHICRPHVPPSILLNSIA